MTKEKKQQAKESLLRSLREEGYLDEEDGVFVYTVFPNDEDRLHGDEIKKIISSESPKDAFRTVVVAGYEAMRGEFENRILDNAVRYSDMMEEFDILCYLQEELRNVLRYDYEKTCEHYLEKVYDTDIMIDTGDLNYCFSCNSPYPSYYGEKGAGIEACSALVWLAGTQGYTKRQLEKALNKGDVKAEDMKGFLDSVRQEVANETSGSNCLTFLVKMTLEEILDMNVLMALQEPNGEKIYVANYRPDCGTVKLGKKTTTGLLDTSAGAGSVLEINLEKDVLLPLRYVWRCIPDECLFNSVKAIYNVPGQLWKTGMVSSITPPKQFTA